jgi:phosphinothricin acetyltransferase
LGTIRRVGARDAGQIRGIYNHYVERTVVSFEEEPVSVPEMERRIAAYTAAYPWLVFEERGEILGYCYASKWRDRSAYRRSVEVTVYVKEGHTGAGIGRELYAELLEILRDMGIHVVMAGITLPNEASVALHEAMGFEKVARLREIGLKFGRWIDVGFWEAVLSP